MGSNAVVVAVVLSGCSFVYNPSNIGTGVDADSIADVDPTMLTLTDVYPPHVYEGAGTGNSRPSLLVIYGHQIAPDATVTIAPATPDPSTVTITSTTIAADHNFIALTVRVEDDMVDDDSMNVPLSITVSQSAGAYHAELPSSVMLMHLNQLKTVPTANPPKQLYSTIAISAPITFATAPAGSHVVMRAVGSITIGGKITADAVGPAPGPGGCAGGAIGVDGASTNVDSLNCTGRGFTVAGGFLNGGGGGGAGFVVKGEPGTSSGGLGGEISGTNQLADATQNVPSGGAGGATNTGAGGGSGGGGGGSIEITAGGDLSITAGISANAANGNPVTNGGGGGGGAGGAILVRAGGAATIGALDVKRGEGGTATQLGKAGGAGSVGRTRIDAPNIITGATYFGPTFVNPPSTSTEQVMSLTVHGAIGDTTMVGQAFDRDGNAVDHGGFTPAFNGTGIAMPSFSLKAGYNNVCVTVQGGNAFTLPESANCTEIAFLP
jgi:hypothetical protein